MTVEINIVVSSVVGGYKIDYLFEGKVIPDTDSAYTPHIEHVPQRIKDLLVPHFQKVTKKGK